MPWIVMFVGRYYDAPVIEPAPPEPPEPPARRGLLARLFRRRG